MGRINVFLGANGTGKSKLLAELRGQIAGILPDYPPLNIEGGRAITMYDSLAVTANNFSRYQTFDQTIQTVRNKRGGTLNSRLFDGLKALEQMAEEAKSTHSDQIMAWIESGERGKAPRRPEDPMSRVFEIFNDIFPSITLEFTPQDKRLICHKNGNTYGPPQLSDGEKQVFSILVDIIELVDSRSVLFVDEPELNLNPGLANRLWAAIEGLLSKSIFIYATHSVNFAMREEIEHLIVLSNEASNIQELTGLSELPSSELQELLGNIPSLLANERTLVVEGHDESFDSIFYNWLLTDTEFAPAAVGGSEDVIAIVAREGKWNRISPSVSLTGIVDRDYKSDSDVEKLKRRGVIVLDYHEAESYLCFPEILRQIASSLGTTEKLPSISDLEDQIYAYLESQSLQICARRLSAQLTQRIGVSVPSNALKNVSSLDDLERLFFSDIETNRAQFESKFGEPNVSNVISMEWGELQRIVEARDLKQALRMVPGKELLGKLARQIGCIDTNAVARAARRHIGQADFAVINDLRTTLQNAIVEPQNASSVAE